MIGVELVEDQTSRQPLNVKDFNQIWNDTKNRGVLFGSGGINGNVSHIVCFILVHSYLARIFNMPKLLLKQVLRIKPPMCITKADADMGVSVLAESLKIISK